MMSRPQISVIIPTFNRCRVLQTSLARLGEQSLAPDAYEVVVVDDGSMDETQDVVQARRTEGPYALRYLRHENRGPGYTQNRGIQEAAAELVLLVADDMWATPHLLASHLAAHERRPGLHVAILGQVQQSPDLPQTVMHRNWNPFGFDKLEGHVELTCLHFWACNISFYRQFLLKKGLFLERTGAGNEDTELGYRLSQHGLRIFYEPAALTYHHHEVTLESACRRAYQEGSNFDVLDGVPRDQLAAMTGIFCSDAGWPTKIRMLPKELLRSILFYPWVVNTFWIPVLNAAERFPPARFFARPGAYRGVFGSYYRLGVRHMRLKASQTARTSPVSRERRTSSEPSATTD